MLPEFIDIHCHLDFEQFDKDREEVIGRMVAENLLAINIGADLESSKKSVELAAEQSGIFASVGIHPHEAEKNVDRGVFLELARSEKVVAIGECGLDYYRNQKNKKSQEELFRKQIEIAIELKKPLMIHCRDAHDDVLSILNSYYEIHNSNLRGNTHFFSGNWAQAQKYLELGFSLSFAGPITFSTDYDEVIKKMPFERIMAETDSPFAAPVPYRGKRNEPVYVKETVKRIAEIKGVDFEKAAEITVNNAVDFFGLRV